MKKHLLILIIILFLGLFLRVYNLTHFPIFGDEAIYIRWAQQMRAFPELRFVSLSDGKQPLFMWAVIPFLKLFNDPLFAGRFVSVISGLGIMVGIFVLSVILFNKQLRKDEVRPFVKFLEESVKDINAVNVGLLASFLYAISPFSFFFDRMALVESMLALFGIWTLILALLTVVFLRLDAAILAGFALGGALLTKSPAVFFALFLPSVILFRLMKDNKINFLDRNLFLIAPLFIVTYLISFGFYNILRLGPDFHMLEARTHDYVYPVEHIFESPLDPFLPFLHRVSEYLMILGPGIIYILIGLGIYYLFKKNKAALLVLLIWSIIPILIVSEYTQVMTARYVYFAIPYLYVLAAACIFSSDLIKKIIIFGIVIFSLLSFRWHAIYFSDLERLPLPRSERAGYLEEWTSGIGVKESAEIIRKIAEQYPDKEIIVGTEGHFGTLPQGLEIYFQNNSQIKVVGAGIDLMQIPGELIQSKKEGKNTFLLVNESRLEFDQNVVTESGFSLQYVEEFPKAKPPEGERDKLMLFEIK